MDRVRAWLGRQEYQRVDDAAPEDVEATAEARELVAFSWFEYGVFVLLGVAMLWAYNMFLAAGPYLAQRFRSNAWITDNFQAAESTASTVATLGVALLLTNLQKDASYSRRIFIALVVNSLVCALLAVSTKVLVNVSASSYFGFILAMVLSTSVATGFFQNGLFAFAAGYGQSRYTQGIMVGQGIAGVLPCVAQIVLVLTLTPSRSEPARDGDGEPPPHPVPGESSVPDSAALAFFLTAVAVSILSFFALSLLVRNKTAQQLKADVHGSGSPDPGSNPAAAKSVPFAVLATKLFWLASAVFTSFVVTMLFPVFTQKTLSVVPVDQAPRILHPASFIPLAFLMWNLGDLSGRIVLGYSALQLTHRPRLLFFLTLARLIWIPLYYLCNLGGKGAVVNSDFFYLFVVQFLFGMSGGYTGSSCMMGAADLVEPEEREAAGGFMGLCLVLGLAVGSILSFFIS